MVRLRHRSSVPSQGTSLMGLSWAQALADQQCAGVDMMSLGDGQFSVRAAVHERYHGSWFRHWRPIYRGDPVAMWLSSERLKSVISEPDVAVRAIKRVEPRARDWSVLDVKLRSGDRLRFWGDSVPQLTLRLAWLVHGKLLAVPALPAT